MVDQVVLGNRRFAGKVSTVSEVTLEAFTITMSLTGVDPVYPILIRNQAEATAQGPFRTIKAALAALPELIGHRINLQFPPGVWEVGTEEFRDFSRFRAYSNLELNVPVIGICLVGDNSWEQLAGTPASMAVQSYSGDTVVLQADPGLVEDAFTTYYLVVLSGTGAAQFKPIRHHAGTSIQIAGVYSPALNSTSVVQIAKRSTTLRWMTTTGFIEICGTGRYWTSPELNCYRINLESAYTGGYTGLYQQDVTLYFDEGCRIGNTIGFSCTESSLYLDDCIIDNSGRSPSTDASAIIVIFGGRIRSRMQSSRVPFLRGNPITPIPVAIYLYSYGERSVSGAYFYSRLTFQGFSRCYLRLVGLSKFQAGTSDSFNFASDQDAEVAVELENSAMFTNLSPIASAISSSFRGSVSDFRVDGADVTWEEIAADPQETVVGSAKSMVSALHL